MPPLPVPGIRAWPVFGMDVSASAEAAPALPVGRTSSVCRLLEVMSLSLMLVSGALTVRTGMVANEEVTRRNVKKSG